jgi:colanic acid/amylovoran biosynthesis glycosyltransferase
VNILLISESFPFDGPDTPFFPREVAYLGSHAHVDIAPLWRGTTPSAPLPAGVTIVRSLAEAHASRGVRMTMLAKAMLSPGLYRELFRQAPAALRARSAATTASRLARALVAERWMRQYLESAGDRRPDVVYSWWSFAEAYGFARALVGTGIPLVTRMHGYDLFADQEAIGFVPFQRQLIERSTCVASASHAGSAYLKARYPDLSGIITTSYLGTEDPGELNEPSTGGVLRIATCSSNTPVKRVDLLARGLSHMSTTSADIEFHWTHIGSGPLAGDLTALIETLPGLAGRCTLTGHLPPPRVKQWFRDNQVDLFVNTSSSEGLPVSLMEAASFGIPMIATRVGGNPEIVNAANGAVLEPDPSPEEIAEAVAAFARLTAEERGAKRAASRATFEKGFDSEVNYRDFFTLLEAMTAQ